MKNGQSYVQLDVKIEHMLKRYEIQIQNEAYNESSIMSTVKVGQV